MAKVVSTNLAELQTITINGREHTTGIFKNPVDKPIFLGKTGVEEDTVADRKVHGGEDKACYLYPAEHYNYWKQHFPDLAWQWGMFGENLTTEGLIEMSTNIGDELKIGEAIVQVSQPRMPCFKLAYKFASPSIIKLFRNAPFPGIYVRVIKEGFVYSGDKIEVFTKKEEGPSVLDIFALLTKQIDNNAILNSSLANPYLADSAKKDLVKLLLPD